MHDSDAGQEERGEIEMMRYTFLLALLFWPRMFILSDFHQGVIV